MRFRPGKLRFGGPTNPRPIGRATDDKEKVGFRLRSSVRGGPA